MYIHKCPQCGQQYSTEERVNRVMCPYCGTETNVSYNDEQIPQQPYQQSGQQQPSYQQPSYQQPSYQQGCPSNVFDEGPSGRSRGVAGFLALFLGTLGIHYFYLGKTTGGIVFLLVTIISCGFLAVFTLVASIVQGIMMLTVPQQEFENKWIYCPTDFPLF